MYVGKRCVIRTVWRIPWQAIHVIACEVYDEAFFTHEEQTIVGDPIVHRLSEWTGLATSGYAQEICVGNLRIRGL